jgi:1-phosphatidylinositol phosphodiesterase
MKQDQLTKLMAYGGLNKNHLFLLSWTLTPDSGTFLTGSIENLAKEANRALEELSSGYFRQANIPKPNIAYIDYVNEQTASSIIALNFL